MKNQDNIQQFHNEEFGAIEILTIDGKPYFPATDCSAMLGYSKPHDAIARHCRYSVKHGVPHPQNPIKTIEKLFIPEGDLYRLIIRSKLPAAERFEKWVFDDVLPTIRKHGAYATADTLDEMLRSPKFAEALLRRLAEERKKTAALEELAEELAPKALYYDSILQSKSVVPISMVAKDYGMSATAFNRLLHNLRIQYPIGGTWLLYQEYADMGYTQTRTYHVGERTTAMHTCWTQPGRLFLYELLKRRCILPLIEKAAVTN